MQLTSNGISVRIAPSLLFSLLEVAVDKHDLAEWEISSDFSISATVHPELSFRDYLKKTQFSDLTLLQTATSYVRISDTKKWCEIAICADEKLVELLRWSLSAFGMKFQLDVSVIFGPQFTAVGESRIFVTDADPWLTIKKCEIK